MHLPRSSILCTNTTSHAMFLLVSNAIRRRGSTYVRQSVNVDIAFLIEEEL
jgi:hypothetical protein